MKQFSSTLKSFNTEFQPSIDEINEKEEAISKYAGAATMERIKGILYLLHIARHNMGSANFNTNTEIKRTLEDITLQLYGKSLFLSFFH